MKCYLLLASLVISFLVKGQEPKFDSLQAELKKATTTEVKADILNQIAYAYSKLSLPLAEQFANQALEESTAVNYQKGMADANNNLGICFSIKGQYTTGMEYFIKALRWREEQKDFVAASKTLNNISRIYIYEKEYNKAVEY